MYHMEIYYYAIKLLDVWGYEMKEENFLFVETTYGILEQFRYIFAEYIEKWKNPQTLRILLSGMLMTLLPSWNNTAQIPEEKAKCLIITALFVGERNKDMKLLKCCIILVGSWLLRKICPTSTG